MAACMVRRFALSTSRSVSVAFRRVSPTKVHARCFSVSEDLMSERRYTDKHEWVSVVKNTGTVGISDYAQDKLGEVVYVQLPEIGQDLAKDDESASLESVKAASEVYTPVSGKVTAVNHLVEDTPRLINESPYEKGWLYKLDLKDTEELVNLMDEAAYNRYITSADGE